MVCSGRLESFQRKSVREVLRDLCGVDGSYWPNTLNVNSGGAPVCKCRDVKS